MDDQTTIPLDRITLDEFKVTLPSGQHYCPHKGQSVWVYGYGRGVDETARFGTRMGAAETPDDQLAITSEFLAGEIARWDLLNPRTGQPYGDPTPEVVAKLDDKLYAFLFRRIMGTETEGKGGGASGT